MSLIWGLFAVTGRLCNWLRLTELLWCSEWVRVWLSLQLCSYWRPSTHAYISDVPPAALCPPYRDSIKPPTLTLNADLRCHIIKKLHIVVLKLMCASERWGLCSWITGIRWISCQALIETIIPVCLLKPQLKILFETPSFLLFASPSCQRFMQFICRSHRLKPLHWNHDGDSCRKREFLFCAVHVLVPLLPVWSYTSIHFLLKLFHLDH